MSGPYKVELAIPGCPHCNKGTTWKVVGPTLPEWEQHNLHHVEQDVLDTAAEYNAIWAAAIASVARD